MSELPRASATRPGTTSVSSAGDQRPSSLDAVGPLIHGSATPISLPVTVKMRPVTPADRGEPSHTTSYYQVQGRYRVQKEFAFGFQAFGDLGRWDNWASTRQQGHRIGPAIFGKLALDSHQAIKYNAAYLMGRNRIDDVAVRGNTFRVQVEYEF